MKPLLLLSGGLDSVMLWRLLDEPLAAYVRLGHRYQDSEIAALHRMPIQFQVVNRLRLGDLEEGDGHIAYRNLLLATTVAAVFPDVDTIYLGALRGESSRDKTPAFFHQLSTLLSYAERRRVEVTAPALHLTKTKLVALYRERFPSAADLDWLLDSRSCYQHHRYDTIGCGRCMACFRRWVAMSNNRIHEAYDYHPWEWEMVQAGNWRTWYQYTAKADPRHWLGMLENANDARRALKRVRQ